MAKIERTVAAPFIGMVHIEADDEEEYKEKITEIRRATLEY
jgi:hypothetical protein